jgi:hypothetical protein
MPGSALRARSSRGPGTDRSANQHRVKAPWAAPTAWPRGTAHDCRTGQGSIRQSTPDRAASGASMVGRVRALGVRPARSAAPVATEPQSAGQPSPHPSPPRRRALPRPRRARRHPRRRATVTATASTLSSSWAYACSTTNFPQSHGRSPQPACRRGHKEERPPARPPRPPEGESRDETEGPEQLDEDGGLVCVDLPPLIYARPPNS